MQTRAETPPAPPSGIALKPWGLPAILLALALPVLLWASSLGLSATQGEPKTLSTGEIVANLVLSIVILDGLLIALPAAVCLWRYRLSWRELGFRSLDASFRWLPVVAAATALTATVIYSAVLTSLGADRAVPKQDDLERLFESRAILPLTGVAVLVMAPLAEEVFFRGFIFAGLLRPFGVGGAMVASGVLFGAFHITGAGTVGVIVPFSLIGMLFAWLYYRTGSIWTNIAAHFLFNVVGFTVAAAGGGT